MHRCCVNQNMCQYIGYILFVFLEGLFVPDTCLTTRCLWYPDWVVLFPESERWKQITSGEDSKYKPTIAKISTHL